MSQLVIEIHPNQALPVQRKFADKNGNERFFNEQIGFAYNGDVYPVKVKIPLSDGQAPYPAGKYHVHASSFKAGDYEKLQISRLILEPMGEEL